MAKLNKTVLGTACAAVATVGVIGATGLGLIKEHEGLRTSTYIDPVGIPTVCYGHTGRYAKRGATYTEEKCEEILIEDIQKHREGIEKCISADLNQNQWDAVTSFAFNIGVSGTCRSTLVRKLNAGDEIGAANQFPRWVYAGGRKFRGLVRRRHEERELFLTPVTPEQDVTVRFDHLATGD